MDTRIPSNDRQSPAEAAARSCAPLPALGTVATEVYDENGVDRSLIRSSLRRTPTECLEILEDMHRLAESVRRVR